MRPYSVDLRERIVTALRNGSTQPKVAEQFSVSLASVQRFARQARTEGNLNPKPIPGRKRAITQEQESLLLEILAQQNNPTLVTLAQEWQVRTGKTIVPSTIHYTLQRLGYSYKKNADCSGAL